MSESAYPGYIEEPAFEGILASSSLGRHHKNTITKFVLYRHVFCTRTSVAHAHTVSFYDRFKLSSEASKRACQLYHTSSVNPYIVGVDLEPLWVPNDIHDRPLHMGISSGSFALHVMFTGRCLQWSLCYYEYKFVVTHIGI